jgi:hypothetical protein
MSGKPAADAAAKPVAAVKASREKSRKRKVELQQHQAAQGAPNGEDAEQPQSSPKATGKRKTKQSKRESNATAPTEAERKAIATQIVVIDDDLEFANALKKHAVIIKGMTRDIREARDKRLRQQRRQAKTIDLQAVRDAVAQLAQMPDADCRLQCEADAPRLNMPVDRLYKMAASERKRIHDEEVAKRRAFGGSGLPPGPLPDGVSTPQDALKYFNDKYWVTCDAGRVFVCEPRDDPQLHRRFYVNIRPTDFKILHANRRVLSGTDDQGEPGYSDAVPFWFKHPERHQYPGGLVFRPNGNVALDQYNLWQGFRIKPHQGKYPRFREHLFSVLCNGQGNLFDYLFGWMASAVQHPELQGEAIIVVIGDEGAGKSISGEIFGRLFGQHALTVSHAKHLTGNFNYHLRDCVFLLGEEVFHTGDKAAAAALRAMTTGSTLVIEGKGANVIACTSC